jgi:prevent-host-death family protein
MKIASVAHVKAKFSEYVKATDSGPVVITRNGKAVAAIVSLSSDDDVERLLIGYSPRRRAVLGSARKRLRAGQGIAHAQFWREIESAAAAKARRKSA